MVPFRVTAFQILNYEANPFLSNKDPQSFLSKVLLSGRFPLRYGAEVHAFLAQYVLCNLKFNLGLKSACPAMASGVSKSVIWGTAAGAATMIFVMGSIMIVLCWRSRDRVRIDQAYTVEERRPNEYSDSHFWMTDTNVTQTPGSRTGRRKVLTAQ